MIATDRITDWGQRCAAAVIGVCAWAAAASPATAAIEPISPADGTVVTLQQGGFGSWYANVQVLARMTPGPCIMATLVTSAQSAVNEHGELSRGFGGSSFDDTHMMSPDPATGDCVAGVYARQAGTMYWQVQGLDCPSPPTGTGCRRINHPPRSVRFEKPPPPPPPPPTPAEAPAFRTFEREATAGKTLQVVVEDRNADSRGIRVLLSSSPPGADGLLPDARRIEGVNRLGGVRYRAAIPVPDQAGPFWIQALRTICDPQPNVDCQAPAHGVATKIDAVAPPGGFRVTGVFLGVFRGSVPVELDCRQPPCQVTLTLRHNNRQLARLRVTMPRRARNLRVKLKRPSARRLWNYTARHRARVKITSRATDRFGRTYRDRAAATFFSRRELNKSPDPGPSEPNAAGAVRDAVEDELHRFDESFNPHEIDCRRLSKGYWRCDFSGLTRQDISDGRTGGHRGTAYATKYPGGWDVTIVGYGPG